MSKASAQEEMKSDHQRAKWALIVSGLVLFVAAVVFAIASFIRGTTEPQLLFNITYWLCIVTGVWGILNFIQGVSMTYSNAENEVWVQLQNRVHTYFTWIFSVVLVVYLIVLQRVGIPGVLVLANTPALLKQIISGLAIVGALSVNESLNADVNLAERPKGNSMVEGWPRVEGILLAWLFAIITFALLGFDYVVQNASLLEVRAISWWISAVALAFFLGIHTVTTNTTTPPSPGMRTLWIVIGSVVLALVVHVTTYFGNAV